jgi:CheY-like chemotaxis protein
MIKINSRYYISDINMPVMNGWAVNKYIMLKSKIEKVLIYIVSSSNNPDDLIQAKHQWNHWLSS